MNLMVRFSNGETQTFDMEDPEAEQLREDFKKYVAAGKPHGRTLRRKVGTETLEMTLAFPTVAFIQEGRRARAFGTDDAYAANA
jgi:hypothetical protein